MKLDKKFIIIGILLIIALALGLSFFFLHDKNEEKEELPTTTTENKVVYLMLDDLFKIEYTKEYGICNGPVCTSTKILTNVTNYEILIENNAIYNDLDKKNKSIEDFILDIYNVSKENEVSLEEINIYTNDDFTKDDLDEALKDKVNINYEDKLNEEEIINANKVKEYQVIFNSNGGSIVESQKVKENDLVVKPDDPERDGYTFVEWQLNDKKYDFKTKVTSDTTLKATWEKKKTSSTTTTKPSTTTPTKNYESTIDKINLNEAILIKDNFYRYGEVDCYYFVTNFAEVFPNLAGEYYIRVINDRSIEYESNYDLLMSEWEEGFKKFTFDTEKEANALNVLKTLTDTTYKGMIFTGGLSQDNHGLYYRYRNLTIEDKDFTSLKSSIDQTYNDVVNKLNVLRGGILVEFPNGSGGYDDVKKLLTEDVCEDYNLVCSRW